MPVTPLSSAGASSPSTSVVASDSVEDEDFDAGGEVTLVKRNTGKGYRYQRKGELVEGQTQVRERRSSSSSSNEERKRASAAEKVETSRIKARAARLAEQEKEAREQEEAEQAQRQENQQDGEGEGGTDSGRGSTPAADPVVSYAQQMQNHMLSLMKGMEAIQVGSGFVKKQENK